MSAEKKLTGYPSIDKPWLKYYSEEALSIPIPEKTVFESIYENNCEHLSDIALEYFGRKITYKTLFENVELVKNAFVANGVKKGDRVIMFTSSTPELVYAVLALCRIGAVANMINPVFTLDQIKDRINETDAEVMMVLDQLFGKIQPIMDELCIKKTVIIPVCNGMSGITKMVASIKMKKDIPYADKLIKWSDFISGGKKVNTTPDIPYEKDMPLVMVYSSGTTGASKGIVLTNDSFNGIYAHHLIPEFPCKRGQKYLQMVPLWFSTGMIISLLIPMSIGVSVILEPIFSEKSFVNDIKKYKPNATLTPTSLWIYAIQCSKLNNVDMSYMIYPLSGGEQVSPSVEILINEFLEKHNCKIELLKGYGMCELGSGVTCDSLWHGKPESAGFPLKGITASAFDIATNKELKYGERGEIRVDSPAHMKEYYKNPKATDEYFYKDENGTLWGCTGDIGYVDEDGFIYILGRANDTFTAKNGETMYCFDIEAEIMKNDNVAQCEVVGLSVDNYDVPVVHIVVDEKCNLSEDELIAAIHKHCHDVLNEYAVPCGYKICKTFPVKASGKRDMETIKQDRNGFVVPVNDDIISVTF